MCTVLGHQQAQTHHTEFHKERRHAGASVVGDPENKKSKKQKSRGKGKGAHHKNDGEVPEQ